MGIAYAIEKAIGIEAPERAQWIRVLLCEMARISSHLMAMGATCMDVGALTLFLWTFTEREKLYDIFELICGARFTTSFSRIGGIANDLSPEILTMIREWVNQFPDRLKESEGLVNRNRIFIERLAGVGYMPADKAIQLGLSGPCLRGSGINHDLRRATPYWVYDKLDFD
ncbi:MAG: NADH-quinone oxidoreductase subunit D, partial [Bacteroidota bacterium]